MTNTGAAPSGKLRAWPTPAAGLAILVGRSYYANASTRANGEQHARRVEETGHYRPAVVLSPLTYGGRTGGIVCCPTTTRIKRCPFEVGLIGSLLGARRVDQVRSQDCTAHKATRKDRTSLADVAEAPAKLIAWVA